MHDGHMTTTSNDGIWFPPFNTCERCGRTASDVDVVCIVAEDCRPQTKEN